MNVFDLLSNPASAFGIIGGVVALTAIIAGCWYGIRETEIKARQKETQARLKEAELALKQDMLSRGMSAEEIERVLRVSSGTPGSAQSSASSPIQGTEGV